MRRLSSLAIVHYVGCLVTRWMQALGPGVLFAGAAVGVSHLVQSTRAGAGWGLSLLGVVLFANALKYPAFRFGPQYAAGTGVSLLEGYRRQGRWALWLYAALTLCTMFTVQAAVTIVTAGIANQVLGLPLSTLTTATCILVLCATLLAIGEYRWLERVGKIVVSLLAIGTVAATALALPHLEVGSLRWFPAPSTLQPPDWMFIAALVGWMPSAIDVAVWQSLWTLERAQATPEPSDEAGSVARFRAVLSDFHIGYVGTALLAVCFVVLGASVMHGSSETLQTSPAAFSAQLIDLYGRTLGAWSRPLIGICALLVMFSTTLTVLDGFPRALATLTKRFASEENADAQSRRSKKAYWVSVALLLVGSLVVLSAFVKSLKTMVDIATTASFLTAPMLCILNHRAILQPNVRSFARPAPWLVAASVIAIVVQSVFALYYLSIRFG